MGPLHIKFPHLRLWLIVWLVAMWPATVMALSDQPRNSPVTAELSGRAVTVLKQALDSGNSAVQIQAVDHLLDLNIALDPMAAIPKALQVESASPTPEQIDAMRLLAQYAPELPVKEKWVNKIVAIFRDQTNIKRSQAALALARLNYQAKNVEILRAFEAAAKSGDAQLQIAAEWVLINSGSHDEMTTKLVASLNSPDAGARKIAVEALNSLPARSVPSSANASLEALLARYTHSSGPEFEGLNQTIVQKLSAVDPQEQAAAAMAMAQAAHAEMLPFLTTLMERGNEETRIAAAYAILRIGRRVPQRIPWVDWAVMFCYAAGMLSIGWYYSRQNVTAEDYLLGGRSIKSWLLGLSLFASLLSTLSYLAYPGEMIQHGPMFLMELLAYPLIFLIVGWLVIPFIMRLKVTSAYEILENRFGLSVRMLGSFYFLTLRLLWMSAIIYATSSKVLIPITGLKPQYAPLICLALGVITVIYTSLGGLRAVVMTDVVGSFVLLGGAILTLLTVTGTLGGVHAWWPTHYAPHWQPPKFGFQLDTRITGGWMIIMALTWYVATTTSDQIAIQRFLSSRDAKAARRVLLTTLISIAVTLCFLAMVGSALLAFFHSHPQYLADGQHIETNGDQLFPRYIIFGLPPGITGLVMAGLLSAAMSSLSAGVNAAGSVVTVDFLQRFWKRPINDRAAKRQAMIVSWFVGGVVILLSLFVNMVPGNLFEVVNRVANLFVSPLFILFFMAMFIPWATLFGTWMAALCSTGISILIAYWEVFTGSPGPSFLWIMPVSMVGGALAGMLFSLIPIGPRALIEIHQIRQDREAAPLSALNINP